VIASFLWKRGRNLLYKLSQKQGCISIKSHLTSARESSLLIFHFTSASNKNLQPFNKKVKKVLR
jgi:hypothetical protein